MNKEFNKALIKFKPKKVFVAGGTGFLGKHLVARLKKDKITEADIKEGWKDGKFIGTYANSLLQRAIKDVLIRDLKDGTYDLTQDGENFFETILK